MIMTALTPSTRRRLLQLKQLPSVWEGARLSMPSRGYVASTNAGANTGDCVLWVDGSEGIVRAVEVVSPISGQEAVVRTLLRAMETPQNPGQPARPQKIVVSDRELQFFLRGVLQEIGIVVEYVPTLPLIDELYRNFMEMVESHPPQLPPYIADEIVHQAMELWSYAPWEYLSEDRVIAIELNTWDVGTLYLSVMGMLGMEYGVLMYRSINSLYQFRQTAMDANGPMDEVQEAFLRQDCLFVTFDREEDDDEDISLFSIAPLSADDVEPSFGNLHPLEGMRFNLQDDEANAMFAALTALNRFLKQHRRKFTHTQFPELSKQYRIAMPSSPTTPSSTVSVRVSTMPELSAELVAMTGTDDEPEDNSHGIQDSLIPEGAFLTIGMLPWDMLDTLRSVVEFYQKASSPIPQKGDGLPIVLIQTSQLKGKALIKALKAAGGLKGISFNPGSDPYHNQTYDLGILQLENGELQLFGEFEDDDPIHRNARKKWNQRCKATKGYCGLVIAKGTTTKANRNQPQTKDMLGLLETRFIPEQELGIGSLEMRVID